MGIKEKRSKAEAWADETIAKALQAKKIDVMFYTPTAYAAQKTKLPDTYVIITPDVQVIDIEFADNKSVRQESLIEIVVQGVLTQNKSPTLEISKVIHEILRTQNSTQFNVRSITNVDLGFNEQANKNTRLITCWYSYQI